LKPGGRLACICFHSGEARAVREFARPLERDYEVPEGPDVPELRRPRPARLGWVRRKGIVPSAAELEANPRARSARLWAMVKLADIDAGRAE
jgi:16S rRNA (cytosine1402-N4)-methyltransferase